MGKDGRRIDISLITIYIMDNLLKYSVGVDISKEKLDACVSVIDINQRVVVKATRQFDNTLSGFKQFAVWIKKNHKANIALVVIMEATGVYYERFALHLSHKGVNVIVVLPNKAKKYIQSIGYKRKNDKIDAKALEIWHPISENIYELRGFTRQNKALQEERTIILNRIEAQTYSQKQNKFVVAQLDAMLKLIDKQIQQVILEIEKCIDKDEALSDRVKNIKTLKGLGTVTIATVIAETNGFLLFKNHRQLVSYAGYDVVENQSGKRSGKTKISKRGNSHIRRALHMPAFSVVKYNPDSFGHLYQRAYESSGYKMKGYVAVQRKILIIIYTLWKKNEAFDGDYKTAGDEEQKPLFSACSEGTKKVPA